MFSVQDKTPNKISPFSCFKYFFYSYSYDLTHNLQHQIGPVIYPQPDLTNTGPWQAWTACRHVKNENKHTDQSSDKSTSVVNCHKSEKVEQKEMRDHSTSNDPALSCCHEDLDNAKTPRNSNVTGGCNKKEETTFDQEKQTGITNPESSQCVQNKTVTCPDCVKIRQQWEKPFFNKKYSSYKFVWNKYLLQGFEGAVHSDWILHIVNGFVGQSGILLF